MSANRVCTTSLSRIVAITWRRACRSPRFAKVTSFSASGRSRFALVSVVVIRPCSNSEVARLASISRSCEGDPPRRGPLVGVGMSVLPQAAGRCVRGCGSFVVQCGGRAGAAGRRGVAAVRPIGSKLLGLPVVALGELLHVAVRPVLGRALVGVGLVALVVALDGGGDES